MKLIRIVVLVALIVAGVFLLIPVVDNPPVTAELAAPAPVKQVLQKSCYDCHSNESRIPVWERVPPVRWMVAHDVTEARAHLNFSEIAKLPAPQQKALIYEAVNQAGLGAMPLPRYLAVHKDAAVTPADLDTLHNWLLSSVTNPVATPAQVALADGEYAKWVGASTTRVAAKPSLTGIALMADYRDWTPIASTERFDNHTMRVVLGNDVAVKAIAEGHTNPWPDGAVIAKVAWQQQLGTDGVTHTGQYWQVEFMLRDSAKYSATKGWGWARWRDLDWKPYGKNADYTKECIGCHEPVKQNDYMYTVPVKFASVADGSAAKKLVTSWINQTDGTMTTLMGNDVAVAYARTHADGKYPAGSVLRAVTWKQQADPHWFGARTPLAIVDTETVSFDVSGKASYAESGQKSDAASRIAYLTGQRAAVMP